MPYRTTLNSIRTNRSWIPYFVLLVALTVTTVGATVVWVTADTQQRSRFENAVQSTEDTIRDRLNNYTLLLQATSGLFAARLGIRPDEFYPYAQALELEKQYPGVAGLGWTIRLTPEQVPELERVMREYLDEDFRVWPIEPAREEYHSIVYLEPRNLQNQRAIGYDMHSNPIRAAAMDRARDTGEPTASGIVQLVQGGDELEPGFLVYLPVYRGEGSPGTVEERRERLAGFAYSVFHADDLLKGIFGSQTQPRVDFAVYDGGIGGELTDVQLIFRSGTRGPEAGPPRMVSRAYLNFCGRTWTVAFTSRPQFETPYGQRSGIAIIIGGTLIALLLFGLTRAQTMARDATERGAAALADSEMRFRSLFTQSPVTIQLFAPDGTTIAVNDAWERLWGTSRRDVEGYNILQDPTIAEDATLQALRRAFEGEIVEVPPAWYDPAASGNVGRGRWVEAFVYPIKDEQGRVREVVLMLVDVTDRLEAERRVKLSEERYRSLVSATAQIVWTTNATGAVVEDLPEWRRFTGQTPEEILDRGWSNAVHPDDRDRIRLVWEKSLRDKTMHEQEFRVRRHDGQWRDIVARAVPVLEENGDVREWVGTCADITDRKRAEAERDALLLSEQAARADAERANKLKDEFLATMSHELRTPLNAILGWAQLLRMSTDEDEIRHGLETIDRNAQAQARLVEDLLDISRIITGKLRLELRDVQMESIIDSAIASARPLIEEKSIRLSRNIEPTPVVSGDPHRLQQIIWNVISNAVKFTPAGGRISISLRHEAPNVVVSVSDTGCGISADFLPHVFDRFRQADASTTRRFGGLGLGLGIVRHLVELHGGTVQAISEGENCGSTFTVTIPTRGETVHPTATEPPPASVSTTPPYAGELLSGVDALIVDDDADSRELLTGLLQLHGATTRTVISTREGLDAIQERRPDVLISDISMPEEDGYVLIQQIRAIETARGVARVPAIALTALARSEDHLSAIAAGFDLHISKPIENRRLVESIASLLGRHNGADSAATMPR